MALAADDNFDRTERSSNTTTNVSCIPFLTDDNKAWSFTPNWISENETKSMKPKALQITNPLVAMIAISKYDDIGLFSDNYKNLKGIQHDVSKNIDLWNGYLNYDMNILTDKEQTDKEITLEKATQFFENIRNGLEENKNGYDSLICVLSGHGHNEALKCADRGSFKLSMIHDMFNCKALKSFSNKPKIFLIDLCRGGNLPASVRAPEKTWKRWKGVTEKDIHPDSDINIIYSNTKKYSVPENKTGSVMMPCLLNVFTSTNLTKHPLTNIITMLAEQVGKKSSLLCIESVSRIKYLIYFQKRLVKGEVKYINRYGKQIIGKEETNSFFGAIVKGIYYSVCWWMRESWIRNKIFYMSGICLCSGLYVGTVLSNRDVGNAMPDFGRNFTNVVIGAVNLVVEIMKNIGEANTRKKK
eukprot:184539_1